MEIKLTGLCLEKGCTKVGASIVFKSKEGYEAFCTARHALLPKQPVEAPVAKDKYYVILDTTDFEALVDKLTHSHLNTTFTEVPDILAITKKRREDFSELVALTDEDKDVVLAWYTAISNKFTK